MTLGDNEGVFTVCTLTDGRIGELKRLRIQGCAFIPYELWYFSEGLDDIQAVMTDSRYMDAIDRREVKFGYGDVLECAIAEGPNGGYEVVEVYRHEGWRRVRFLPFCIKRLIYRRGK